MLKILLSPAKSISKERISIGKPTIPILDDKAAVLASKLKLLEPHALSNLMSISPALAEMNWSRFQDWTTFHSNKLPIQPALAFTGEVYKGLDAHSFDLEEWNRAQASIRILSGLYGLLKPLDGIHAYRLEMGTKLKVNCTIKNLYEYWNEDLTNEFLKELSSDDVVVNLASKEYSKVLNFSTIPNPIITPLFKDFKNGKLKTIMMYAKNARGSMARHIIKEGVTNCQDLKRADIKGYRYTEELSNAAEWVFTR